MKLGVIAALRTELKPIQAALPPESPFLFVASGVGAVLADAAARALPLDLAGILSVGFCGALTDELSPGDLVIDPTGSPALLEAARKAGPHRLGGVRMVDHVIITTEEKREIATATGAMAVDMESQAVARVGRERSIAFLCVKVVLDTPSRPLASTYASAARVALDVLKRPWIVARMIRDGKRAGLAAERLRDFFVAFAKQVQPPKAS